MNALSVGTRVIRKAEIGGTDYRHGTITEVYKSSVSHVGVHETLYAVRWDDTKLVERGYLFLEQEPLSVGGLGV